MVPDLRRSLRFGSALSCIGHLVSQPEGQASSWAALWSSGMLLKPNRWILLVDRIWTYSTRLTSEMNSLCGRVSIGSHQSRDKDPSWSIKSYLCETNDYYASLDARQHIPGHLERSTRLHCSCARLWITTYGIRRHVATEHAWQIWW